MGKTYSKQEEIIIAQNGANNSDWTNVESHIKISSIMLLVILMIIVCVIFYVSCRKCKRGIQSGLRKEIGTVIQQQVQAQTV